MCRSCQRTAFSGERRLGRLHEQHISNMIRISGGFMISKCRYHIFEGYS